MALSPSSTKVLGGASGSTGVPPVFASQFSAANSALKSVGYPFNSDRRHSGLSSGSLLERGARFPLPTLQPGRCATACPAFLFPL